MLALSKRYTLLLKFRFITMPRYGRLHRTFYRNFDCTIPRQALHSSVSADNMLSNGPRMYESSTKKKARQRLIGQRCTTGWFSERTHPFGFDKPSQGITTAHPMADLSILLSNDFIASSPSVTTKVFIEISIAGVRGFTSHHQCFPYYLSA